MAMTAWSQKVWTSSTWREVNAPGSVLASNSTPSTAPSRVSGTARTALYSPITAAGPKLYSGSSLTSGTWAGFPSIKTRPVIVLRFGLIGLAFINSMKAGVAPDSACSRMTLPSRRQMMPCDAPQSAAADSLGSLAQGLDRADHAPGQENPGEHREDRRTRQHDGEALQRQIQRRIGLLHGQFDKHRPAQRRDRGGCRQHLLPLDVLRALQGIGAGIRRSCLRGLNLQQLRHVGVAQHQADVRMRDQSPLRADDIGMTALADLDLGNHVPDQLQVDLGDADTGVLAGAGQR